MHFNARPFLLMLLLIPAAAALCGCEAKVDESLLSSEADYSINISLPYATVTPPPAEQSEQADALVIDASGSVTVNDSASVLQNDVSSDALNASNYKSLRLGNTGLAVQALQTRLQELGYYTAGVSGIFDSETEAAVKRFEQSYGTMQTGVATADMQSRLFAADALTYGSEAYNNAVVSQYRVLTRGDVGSAVYALQQRLKNLGYPIGELTGIFDNETANAVMLFYEAYGLTGSDIANVELQKELYSDSARGYNGASNAARSVNAAFDGSVSAIQERLIQLGYMTGMADGDYDRRTEIAIKLFEEACGQLPSGTLSSDMLSRLNSESAPAFQQIGDRYANLLEGSSGDDVLQLQNRLVELGFATGSPTGEYGEATTSSLRIFQHYNGLEETGVADSYTQAVLYSGFALNINSETVVSAPTAEPSPTPEPEIAPTADVPELITTGASGDDVLQLQSRLTELGYVTSLAGTYDSLTASAVSAIQEAIGCESNGVVSRALLNFILSKAAPRNGARFYDGVQSFRSLTLGDSGDGVAMLQKRLCELGYLSESDLNGSAGIYGESTRNAVTQLQEALGYTAADGTASVELQCYLFAESGQSFVGD